MKKNFEISKLKITTSNVRQIVKEDEGRIITKVDYCIKLPVVISNIAYHCGYEDSLWVNCIEGTCTAITTLSSDDKWDLEKGKKISRARAERNVYRQATNRIFKIYRRIHNALHEFGIMADNLEKRADEVIKHNEDYIDEIV